MLIVTSEKIAGWEVKKSHGLVSGSNVRAKNLFKDFGAEVKNLVGGEIHSYSKLLDETRNTSINAMIKQAEAVGANAIIAVRFSSSSISPRASEVYVYGTAVTVVEVSKT